MIKKKKIVVTGGSGYIGSSFAKMACKKYKIYTLDKKDKNKFLKNREITHVKCNLNNFNKLKKKLIVIKPDIILHLAAQSTIDFIHTKKKLYLKDNINGTKNIIKISKFLKIKKFIFSSTAAVYKNKNNELSENDKLLPNNLYGKTKLKNEKIIKKSFDKSKINYCIIRFFNVCSSIDKEIGEFHNPETHLIPKVINTISLGKTIKIYGNKFNTYDGTCIRDYVHIKDIVVGLIKSITYLEKNKKGIFNLGSGKGISVKEIVKDCCNFFNTKSKTIIMKKRKGDVDKLVCKISKAETELKWKPKNSKLTKIIYDEIKWQNFLKTKNFKRSFHK